MPVDNSEESSCPGLKKFLHREIEKCYQSVLTQDHLKRAFVIVAEQVSRLFDIVGPLSHRRARKKCRSDFAYLVRI